MPNIDLGQVVGAQGPEGPAAQGTMMEATYDPTGKAQDVFAYADTAKKEAKDYAAPKTHASQHASGGSDPITPDDIGAIKKSGDTMTGTLSVPNLDVSKESCGGYIYGEQNGLCLRGGNPNTESYHYFGIWEDGVYVDNQKVYHAGNKPTPSEIGAAASSHNHDDRYYKLSDVGIARIVTGSYVGTGESNYGVGYHNVLTFDFAVKYLFVYQVYDNGYGQWMLMVPNKGHPFTSGSTDDSLGYSATVVSFGQTAEWYSNRTTTQGNEAGKTYYYVAIG